MSSATMPAPPVYGVITLDGQQYIERHQLFVEDVRIDVEGQRLSGLRLTLPGTANFLLKGLSRDITAVDAGMNSIDQIFRFRIVNSEGSTWYFSGGLGIFDDLVFSSLCFGSGQFPFPLIPPVPVHATGSLVYDIQDAGPLGTGIFPYIIHLGFHGVYLLPVEQGQPPLAFGGGHGTLRTG